jgi:hypothetical protein
MSCLFEKSDVIRGLHIVNAACASVSWALQPTEYAEVQQVCRSLSDAAMLDNDSEESILLQDLLLHHQLVHVLARAVGDGLSCWQRQQQASKSKPAAQTQQYSNSNAERAVEVLTMLSEPLGSCLMYAAGPSRTAVRADCAKQVEASGGHEQH